MGAAGHALHTVLAPIDEGVPGTQGVDAYVPTGQTVQAAHTVLTPALRGEPAFGGRVKPRRLVVGPPLPHVPVVYVPAAQVEHAASTVSTEQPPLPQLLQGFTVYVLPNTGAVHWHSSEIVPNDKHMALGIAAGELQ